MYILTDFCLSIVCCDKKTAPTVNVYGLRYSTAEKDYCASLSAATVTSTVLGVPLLFLCVVGIQIMQKMDLKLMEDSLYYLNIPSTLAAAWVLLVFLWGGNIWRERYTAVVVLVVLSFVRGVLGMVCYHTHSHTGQDVLTLALLATGVAIHVFTALTALSLTPLLGSSYRLLFLSGTVVVLAVTTGAAALLRVSHDNNKWGDHQGCVPAYDGQLDAMLSILNTICILLTAGGLFFKHNKDHRLLDTTSTSGADGDTKAAEDLGSLAPSLSGDGIDQPLLAPSRSTAATMSSGRWVSLVWPSL